MLTTSADYKTAIAATDREMRGYVEFNGDSTKIMRGCDGLISIVTTAQIADEERPMFGCACASICEMTFYNSGLPAGVSLANSYFDAYVGIVLEDTGSAPLGSIEPDTATVEYVWMGRFIIDTIDRSKLSTKVTAYDDFTKLNKPYVCNVAETPAGYPINQIVGDIRTQCNLFASSTPSAPMGYVPKIYECTCRQMYGWVMSYFSLGSNMMARGGNVQNNYYTTVWGAYTHKDDAGHTITDDTIYMGGLADSPTFTFNSVVTGTEDNPVSVGSGTGIVGENPYFDAARATSLYNNINGLTFTPMTIEWRGDPAIQQGDIMKVVTGGNTYYTYVQRIVSTFNGGFKQTFECYGDSEYHYDMSTSPTQAAIKTAVSNMAQEIQQEIETADNGVITKILDLDGSWKELVIANNQDLSAATSVWRWNINGLAHSTAYSGGTYNFAVDMNGRIIADVIQTGTLQDSVGNNYWNLDTGEFQIKALNNFGGRNILLNSATLQWSVLNGATVTHTTGQSVTEWLCNDAIRAVGNCGNVNGVCLQMYLTSQTSNVYLADTHYIMSCYIKNNHATKSLWLAANDGTSEEIAPGEAKRAVAEADGDGSTALRMRIYVAHTGDPFDFTYWHPQIECGEVLTAWNPAPEDKVGNNEIISKINVSTEGIVIQASKVDLAGYVTFTNLSTSGQTTVNGANITTGLIQDAAGKNSWNLDTGALSITNGTINITTSSSTYDQIVLSYGNSKTTYSASAVSSILTNGGAQVARNWLGSQYFYMYDKNDDVIMSLYNGTSGGAAGTGYLRLYNGKAAQNYVPTVSITNSLLANQSDIGVEDSTLSPKSLDFNEGAGNGTQTGLARYSNNGLSISKSQVVLLKQDKNGILFRNSSGTKTAEYPATGYNSQALESRNLCGRGAPLYNSGVTFTVNFDGSVTTSGVSTNDIIYNFASFTSDGSEYKLSGCPAGGSATTFFMYYAGHSTDGWRDTGSGAIQTLSAGTWTPRIYVCSGVNMNGKTFYPMVQRKNLEGNYSGTYVPWVSDLSTRECTYPTTRGNAMLANGLPVTLTFNGNTVAIISAIGYLGNAYGVFLYTGYALGSARQTVTKLVGSSAVTATISESGQSITLSYTGAAGMYVSVLPLFGPTPTFSY